MSKGEEAFQKYFTAAHNAVAEKAGRVAKALDPATISLIFGFIIEGLKICFNRNGEQATMERIREGGGLSQREVFRALLKGGYADDGTHRDQRRKCRETAYELAGQGKNVTAEELEAFMNDAKASNVPADSGDAGSGPWGLAIAFVAGLFLIGGTASAQDAGPWPQLAADVATIKDTSLSTSLQVSSLTIEIDAMKADLAEIKAALVPPKEPTPVPQKAAPKAAVAWNGQPINVQSFIRQHPGPTVEIRGSVDAHLREHGFSGDFSGLSRPTKIALHSAAHATGQPARSGVVASSATVKRSYSAAGNCANGNCQLPQRSVSGYRVGIFGRLRPVYR